ncbi:MAG: NAD(P)/FAD-dependent oxidoreductase [Halioglobus sp.]|nr:NAD(P)/FAD-dependent oxidoreductase [Halioglobus sp.]
MLNKVNDRPRIMIIGGGAGGLELATRLGKQLGGKKKAHITLIDKSRVHIWKPLLHQVAAGTLDSALQGTEYRAHARLSGYQATYGAVTHVDRQLQQVTLAPIIEDGQEVVPKRVLPYDILIIAVGGVTHDFSTPGASAHCYMLDDVDSANTLHEVLLNQLLKKTVFPEKTRLSIAIVGGGATGVELAAELLYSIRVYNHYDTARSTPHDAFRISVLEAGPRILGPLPESIAEASSQTLQGLGVKVIANCKVNAVTTGKFMTSQGDIEADILIWAAGVKAPEWLANIEGLESNSAHQLEVNRNLQTTRDERIYAIGDCADCIMADGTKVPPRAQSAHQMAAAVHRNIIRWLDGKPLKAYQYYDFGSLVSLSRFTAWGIMAWGRNHHFTVHGLIAKWAYISLENLHKVAIYGWIRGIVLITVEKINRVVRPKIKLH